MQAPAHGKKSYLFEGTLPPRKLGSKGNKIPIPMKPQRTTSWQGSLISTSCMNDKLEACRRWYECYRLIMIGSRGEKKPDTEGTGDDKRV